jgi:hypothetical protein
MLSDIPFGLLPVPLVITCFFAGSTDRQQAAQKVAPVQSCLQFVNQFRFGAFPNGKTLYAKSNTNIII